nr:hypothetical protein Iba_chr14dCG8190 [Ipomoea batatas]
MTNHSETKNLFRIAQNKIGIEVSTVMIRTDPLAAPIISDQPAVVPPQKRWKKIVRIADTTKTAETAPSQPATLDQDTTTDVAQDVPAETPLHDPLASLDHQELNFSQTPLLGLTIIDDQCLRKDLKVASSGHLYDGGVIQYAVMRQIKATPVSSPSILLLY